MFSYIINDSYLLLFLKLKILAKALLIPKFFSGSSLRLKLKDTGPIYIPLNPKDLTYSIKVPDKSNPDLSKYFSKHNYFSIKCNLISILKRFSAYFGFYLKYIVHMHLFF
jgi:hypothetical protein